MKNKPNFFFDNRGFPNWGGGGGGPPLGNFSHIIPFFSLTTILTKVGEPLSYLSFIVDDKNIMQNSWEVKPFRIFCQKF